MTGTEAYVAACREILNLTDNDPVPPPYRLPWRMPARRHATTHLCPCACHRSEDHSGQSHHPDALACCHSEPICAGCLGRHHPPCAACGFCADCGPPADAPCATDQNAHHAAIDQSLAHYLARRSP